MNVTVVGLPHGGLGQDVKIVTSCLEKFAVDVAHESIWLDRGRRMVRKLGLKRFFNRQADVVIFLEKVIDFYYRPDCINILIPNLDWMDATSAAWMDKMDAIWVKTQSAQVLLERMGVASKFLGFTSNVGFPVDDMSLRRWNSVLHIAGKSPLKGTAQILAIWRSNPWLPKLTVVCGLDLPGWPDEGCDNVIYIKDRLSDAELHQLRVTHGIYLQPSATEGFGHVLMDSLAYGGVCVTLDAAPMNELFRPDYAVLVAAEEGGFHMQSPTYRACEKSLIDRFKEIIAMDDSVRLGMAVRARVAYKKMTKDFHSKFDELWMEETRGCKK